MSITQYYTPPTYEDLMAKCETKETPESHILLVHLPDGFARVHMNAKVDYTIGKVRVFGERPLGYNRISRFNEVYQVPANCEVKRIKGKFDIDERTFTITMPKIIPEELFPKQEQQQSTHDEHEALKPNVVVQETQPNPYGGTHKEGIAPQSATGDDDHKEKTTAATEAEEGTPDKDQGTPQKATVSLTDAKPQTEENSTTAGLKDENIDKEKQSVGKLVEETKDHPNKQIKEITKEEESKGSTTTVESFDPPKNNNTEKEKGKEEIIKMNGEFGGGGAELKKSEKKGIFESTRTRIKDMVASTTSTLAKRFNEEEDHKQKVIYCTGAAAILVVAFGVYASYKCRSSRM